MSRSFLLRPAAAAVALLFALPLSAAGGPAASAVAEGNRRYGEKKFDEAIVSYQKALQELPESPDIFFNLGAAEYQRKNYEQSGKLFGRSIALGDAVLQAQSAYNLGGALFREGKLLESLAAFKKAIELNPRDDDAKFNYEFVSLKLKEQQQQQQQKPPEQKQEQDKKEQKQEEQPAAPQPSPSPSPQPQPQEQEQRKEMNQNEAERMLDALESEEEEQRQEKIQEKPSDIPEVLKDW